MERRLVYKPFVALELQRQEYERLSGIEENVHGLRELNAAMLMIRPKIMTEIMRDSSITCGGGVAARCCADGAASQDVGE